MRALVIAVGLVISAVIALLGWYWWDSSRNRGSRLGYYGQYNRVSNAVASIPGLVITQAWFNGDITLEEFCFNGTVTGRSVSLYFGERDSVRTMSHDAAVAALKQRVEAELSLPNTNK